jgi:two-component system, LytTR family, response regulator
MIKCIIIDDESQAIKLLQAIIGDYCKELQIEACCEDLPSGVKAIKKYNPDIVFLDIEMPGHSGLELMDFFNEEEVNFRVIFTTAYNDYAIQAFKLSAIDYLLKPIQHTQLVDAVARYTEQKNAEQNKQLKYLQQNLNSGENWLNKRVAVPTGQSINFYKPTDIVMIKGESAYSEIYLTDGSKLLASKNLKHFEELLREMPIFLRSHKSYIVNVQQIVQFTKSDGGYLFLSNNLEAGISSDKVQELMGMLK